MSGRYIKQKPYVDDHGIYVPSNEYIPEGCAGTFHLVMTKEMFIEAYNRWIVGEKKPIPYDWDDCEWMNDD